MNTQTPLWRQVQRKNFVNLTVLADYLELTKEQRSRLIQDKKFTLNLPHRLAAKIQKANLEDPILRQFLPLNDEEISVEGFISDPLQEKLFRKKTKLLHKYEGRALLVTTQACAMHCRYCFRRHFEYQQEEKLFKEELQALRDDPSIEEVLLSGGDPLSLEQSHLEYLVSSIDAIPHVKRLRFHTRFPIGIPERIDAAFLNMLELLRVQVWFVIHCNHSNELDEDNLAALNRIQRLGIPVLNQAVLLKGVNDDFNTLHALCSRLINYGIFPYYIHQLDRVQGAAHFEVDEQRGKQLITELVAMMPGYGVPKYVREVPAAPSKVSIV
ncbi:MAG: kamA [Chlamydiales bacterium]|jgi:EF-P beta-lysylation protein EpmB|nr:kamA [Chlamydiales bacterium]